MDVFIERDIFGKYVGSRAQISRLYEYKIYEGIVPYGMTTGPKTAQTFCNVFSLTKIVGNGHWQQWIKQIVDGQYFCVVLRKRWHWNTRRQLWKSLPMSKH